MVYFNWMHQKKPPGKFTDKISPVVSVSFVITVLPKSLHFMDPEIPLVIRIPPSVLMRKKCGLVTIQLEACHSVPTRQAVSSLKWILPTQRKVVVTLGGPHRGLMLGLFSITLLVILLSTIGSLNFVFPGWCDSSYRWSSEASPCWRCVVMWTVKLRSAIARRQPWGPILSHGPLCLLVCFMQFIYLFYIPTVVSLTSSPPLPATSSV